MFIWIQNWIDAVGARVVSATDGFVKTRFGRLFLGLSLVGPFSFLPTVWGAWTAENIDALRTITWPMMTIVNISVFVSVCHNGDWRIRLTIFMWIILMGLVWVATLVR